MRRHGLATFLALLLGSLLLVSGIFLIGGYVYWAVIARFGEPDQSLLFWYLPILIFGLGVTATGVATFHWGWRRWRESR